MFNPSQLSNRAITMKRPGRPAGVLPQTHMTLAQNGPRRSVFDPGATNPIGGGGRGVRLPPNGPVMSMQTPSTTKRKGINSIVLDGNSKRPKVELGGNNPRELAQLRQMGLANSPNVPVLDDANPRIQQLQLGGAQQLPMASGMPGFRNPLPMNVNYSRNEGGEQVVYQGLRQPLPSVATMAPSFASSLSNTASNATFVTPNQPSARTGQVQNPTALFADAARRLEKNTKSGTPNARITYTVRLAEAAAAYAAFAQEKMILITPVMTDDDSTTFNARMSELMLGQIDIEYVAFNLAIANYMLALSQLYPTSRDQIITPDQVIDSFRYSGIVASEEGPTQSQYTNKADAHIHRNIVFTIQGEADVFNYWGAVHYGQKVGLIVKGVALKNVFAHHYLDVGTYNIDAMNPAAVRKLKADALSNNPVQFVPWYDKTGMAPEPSAAELEYVDDFGELRLGRWIPVGTVIQLFDVVADEAHIARSWTSVAATVQSGMIRVLVDTTR